MLISSSGITLSTHYCMGRAVASELMIGMCQLNCGMLDMDVPCDANGNESRVMAPGCCDNEYLSIDIEDDYQNFQEDISLVKILLSTFYYAFVIDTSGNSKHIASYIDKYPPPIEQDFQTLHQSFLL